MPIKQSRLSTNNLFFMASFSFCIDNLISTDLPRLRQAGSKRLCQATQSRQERTALALKNSGDLFNP